MKAAMTLPDLGAIPGVGRRWIEHVIAISVGVLSATLALGVLLSIVVTVDRTVDASGTVEPEQVHPVRSAQSGIVAEVRVRSGSVVRKGEVVATLDSASVATELIRTQSSLASRSASLDRLRLDSGLQRLRAEDNLRISDADVISKRARYRVALVQNDLATTDLDAFRVHYTIGTHAAIDQAETDLRIAEAKLRLARLEVEQAELAEFDLRQQGGEVSALGSELVLARRKAQQLTITADADGTVLTELPERLVGSMVTEGNILFEIASAGRWVVQGTVGAQDVQDVRAGERVRTEIQALPVADFGWFDGVVHSVAQEPGAVAAAPGQGGRYRVTIVLELTDVAPDVRARLRRGFPANAHIKIGRERVIDRFLRSTRGAASALGGLADLHLEGVGPSAPTVR